MATSIPINVVAGILECKICLGRLCDPKTLVCHHVFCKECLEDVIKFMDDGTTIVPCPLRCPAQTHIDENHTLNDLGTAFEIKAMLEALNLSTDESLVPASCVCAYAKDCDKEISLYCCGVTMCNYCYKKHETQLPHHRKTNVRIDSNDNNLVVMCEEHLSRCNHVCTDAIHGNDPTFLCVYCINRDHKEHSKDTLEEQVKKMKEALSNISRNIEHLGQIRKVTEENISFCKNKLDEVLQERKEECLTKYIDLLNRDEERIRNEFLNIVDKHMEQYPIAVDPSYYKEMLLKDGAELVLQKIAIVDTICKNNYLQLSLSCIDVSFDNIDFESQYPLGNLNVSPSAQTTFTDLDPSMTTFNDNLTKNSPNYQGISATLSKQLTELVARYGDSSYEPEMNRLHQEIERLTELVEEYKSKLARSTQSDKRDPKGSIMLNVNRPKSDSQLLEELNLVQNESGLDIKDSVIVRDNTSPTSSGHKPPLLPPSYFQCPESDHGSDNTHSHSLENIDSNVIENTSVAFIPTSIEDLVIGMKINVNRRNGGFSCGTIKWLGTLPKHAGDYVGIELQDEVGKHDGNLDGVRYFVCKPGQGKFVNFKYVAMAWK